VLFTAPLFAWMVARGGRAREIAAFGAGFTVAAGPLVLLMNLLKTGSILDAGYGAEGTSGLVGDDPWYGLFGILLSPGCGMVPHTPLLLLGLICLLWLWEDTPGVALVCGAMGLLAIGYYGVGVTTWCAYATWGPRYLLIASPFLCLPLASLWARLRMVGRNPFAWLIVGGAFFWSALTNALAVLIDFNRGWQDHWGHGVTYLETAWLPFFSNITSHFRLFREWLLDDQGGLDLYFAYAAPGAGWAFTVLLLLVSVTCALAAWELAGQCDRASLSASAE
jgi:hypothetical protein